MAILDAPPPKASRGGGVKAIRTAGELLITAGLVVLLFVVYELYVTDLFSAQKQASATSALDNDWANGRQLHPELIDGKAFAKLYIPSFGADYHFTIQEGTDAAALEVGPGHYKGTALPGEPGNFAVAGHRVGKGAPFNDIDLLNSCDAIVVETQTDYFVYRVLPHDDEIANWATGKGKQPQCARVSTLRTNAPDGGAYAKTTGREIVSPTQGDVVSPVPHQPVDILPTAQEVSLLTLTTCHPRFSDRQRLIVHAVLTDQYPKTPGSTYAQLLQAIGEG
ncbi:class E sortase [Amycolatopsis sp. K13G38]|uniref:Class E sortase n=1 Tax=Amycolatopsis acididurans TaxID=2724524 RepID=A0ABX1J0N4_9PSEU|nr:class E sortase [Amycolatopsis acididurans]NKQ53338.1 class E sortase [Amycolatopsis acididurans]